MEDKPFVLRNGLSLEKDTRCILRCEVELFHGRQAICVKEMAYRLKKILDVY